jgi:hypothetical protein
MHLNAIYRTARNIRIFQLIFHFFPFFTRGDADAARAKPPAGRAGIGGTETTYVPGSAVLGVPASQDKRCGEYQHRRIGAIAKSPVPQNHWPKDSRQRMDSPIVRGANRINPKKMKIWAFLC